MMQYSLAGIFRQGNVLVFDRQLDTNVIGPATIKPFAMNLSNQNQSLTEKGRLVLS